MEEEGADALEVAAQAHEEGEAQKSEGKISPFYISLNCFWFYNGAHN